jgi:hypothetical protein
MLEGLTALLLFGYLLWEWPRIVLYVEALFPDDPDPIVARIRMARLRAGLTPWPELNENEENDDECLRHDGH